MITQAKNKLYLSCTTENCEGEWSVGHITPATSVDWSCDTCHARFHIQRLNAWDFRVEFTGMKDLPVTVTLRSVTEPPITLKLNAWKYTHSQHDSPEEYREHQRYFYNEHTCPTNWTNEIEEMAVGDDKDPHGIFKFVSVEDGHYVDPNDMSYDARRKRGEIKESNLIPPLSVKEIRALVKQLKGSTVKSRKK